MALNITYFDQTLSRAAVLREWDERGVAVVRVLVARGEHNIAIVVDDILF